MNHTTLYLEKEAYILELDDVLFPRQDYLLQVYYLFASLLEYTDAQLSAEEVVSFLKETYLAEGEVGLFQKAAVRFELDKKHEASFKSLHVNAKLPLKLLLYKEVLRALTHLIGEGKRIFILTKGNPLMQVNKLKQLEWKGLDQYIKAYFYDEISLKSEQDPLQYVLDENKLAAGDACYIYASEEEATRTTGVDGVEYINSQLIFKPDERT